MFLTKIQFSRRPDENQTANRWLGRAIFASVALTEFSWLCVVVIEIHQYISGLTDICFNWKLTKFEEKNREILFDVLIKMVSLSLYARFTYRYIQCTLMYGDDVPWPMDAVSYQNKPGILIFNFNKKEQSEIVFLHTT